MRVESQALKYNFVGGCTEVEDCVGSCNRFLCSPWGHIIGTNGSAEKGIMKAQVQVALGRRGDWIRIGSHMASIVQDSP